MKEPQPALDAIKIQCHNLACQIYTELKSVDDKVTYFTGIIYHYESEKIKLQSELSTAQEQNRQLVEQYDAKCLELDIAEKALEIATVDFMELAQEAGYCELDFEKRPDKYKSQAESELAKGEKE